MTPDDYVTPEEFNAARDRRSAVKQFQRWADEARQEKVWAIVDAARKVAEIKDTGAEFVTWYQAQNDLVQAVKELDQ